MHQIIKTIIWISPHLFIAQVNIWMDQSTDCWPFSFRCFSLFWWLLLLIQTLFGLFLLGFWLFLFVSFFYIFLVLLSSLFFSFFGLVRTFFSFFLARLVAMTSVSYYYYWGILCSNNGVTGESIKYTMISNIYILWNAFVRT